MIVPQMVAESQYSLFMKRNFILLWPCHTGRLSTVNAVPPSACVHHQGRTFDVWINPGLVSRR